MNRQLLILIPMFLSVLLVVPSTPVHAATTGTVCITSPTATSCPGSAPAFGPVSVGARVDIGVFIQNSGAMGGYDIYVQADPAVLNPTSAVLGSLIVNPALTSICVNGVAQTGSCTVQTANGQGVVEVTTIENSGGNECAGLSPCSGMAFFINYTVVGSAASTSLSYPTAAGCSTSSVSSPVDVCVIVADNTGGVLPEIIQGATVVQTAAQDFLMSASPSRASVIAGSNFNSSITLTSVNGLTGTAIFQTTVPPICLSCPTWTINPATLPVPPVGSNSSILAFYTNRTTPAGSWNVTVTATLKGITHSVSVFFTVFATLPPPDFSLNAFPPSLIVASGHSNSSIISLASLNEFAGTVNLALHVSPINPSTVVTLFPSSVSLTAGGFATSTLTFQSSQTGTYNLNVTATGGGNATAGIGSISHSDIIPVTVVSVTPAPDFSMSANPNPVTVPAGSSNSSTITLTSVNGFSGTVNISFESFLCSGCSLAWRSSVSLQSGGTNTATVTLFTSSTTPIGPFSITMIGTSGTISHPITIYFNVVAPGPPLNFTISASPPSLVVRTGSSNSSTITLTSVNGSSGTVFLSTIVPICPQQPCTTWFVSPSSVNIPAGGAVNAFLTVDAGQQAQNGSIIVTGTAGGVTHQTIVAFSVVVPPPDFSINAFPSNFTISAGQDAYSTIQLSPLIFGSGNFFTVTLTYAVHPATGLTLALNPTIVSVGSFPSYSTLEINTTSVTTPTVYTIVVTGQSSQFIHAVTITVKVLPPPSITLTPTSGPVGTKVLVQGSNFITSSQYGPTELLVTFDDQLVGIPFISTASFNFTFNVPLAQVGQHLVKVSTPFFGTGGTAVVSAPFQVTPTPAPSSLAVSVNVGTIYFPGDAVKAFILVTQNGQPASPTDLQLTVTLLEANGSSIVLTATKLSTGVYTVVYNIPMTLKGGVAPLGTYAIVASAHSASVGDSTAQTSFEVKPTWLATNGKTLVTGVTLVGLAGIVGVAWKKGYFKRKDEEAFLAT